MKTRRVYIPAVLVALIALGLIIYFYMTMPERPMGEGRGPGHDDGHGIFTLLGKIAIVFGAISFWWLRFKKKLASPSDIVKKFGKWVYAAHTYSGWAALILVVVHSVYFLVTDLDNHKIFSGLAAFVLLAALAVYGWLIKRYPNRFVRATHMGLSLLWIPASFVHGGGIMVLVTIVTLLMFAAVWWMEKKAVKAA